MSNGSLVNNPDPTFSAQGPLFDKDQVKAWMNLLHGTSQGLMHVCSAAAPGHQPNWTGRAFSEGADAADYVERLNERGDEGIYLRTTTLSRTLRTGERGGEDISLHLPGFAGDVDIAGPGHKHDPAKYEGRQLPGTIEDVLEIVQEVSGLPTPTLYVHSGGGMYPWWMLDEPIDMRDETMRGRAKTVATKIDKVLHWAAKQRDWHYGTGINDLARVLRIPGTVNRKAGGAQPCRILEPASYNFTSFDALEAAVAALPEPEPSRPMVMAPRPMVAVRTEGEDLTPGEDFENKVGWDDQLLLGGAGWTLMFIKGRTSYWRRPGKTSGDHSATTGNDPLRDRLYVFSSDAAPFTANEPVNKFFAYALLHHNGDPSAAAGALRRMGYGGQRPQSAPTNLADLVRPVENVRAATEPVSAPAAPEVVADVVAVAPADKPAVKAHRSFTLSDVGNGERMLAQFGHKFRYCAAEKTWYEWNGRLWESDETQALDRAAKKVSYDILDEGQKLSSTDEAAAKKYLAHGMASQAAGKIKAAVSMFSSELSITVPASAFDAASKMITLHNGVLDLKTRTLGAFDPNLLARRMFNAAFDADAKAPQFEAFLAKVLPDPAVRAYLRRAMGYTLLGDVNQKAMFILWGASHTGKSQFLIMMEKLFGDFGSAAAASAFKETRSESTNNLHDLKGKRFVTTSETSEHARLNEELIKRLTGKDNVVSRQLYEKNLRWTPEMTIWMATNFLPKISGDDDAMWRRVKPIHFGVVFSDVPGSKNLEVPDIAEKIFDAEASGILNWVLEGVAEVQAGGLGEPEAVKAGVKAYQLESNNVAEFFSAAVEEVMIIGDTPDSDSMTVSQLFAMYEAWCKRERIDKPFGMKRFSNRLRASGVEVRKISTMRCIGWRVGHHGALGTM